MITYFRMKQYLKQTKLLEGNLCNFVLRRAIHIDINSIMFSQSVLFTFTISRPDSAVYTEARPPLHCVALVSVLLLLCQVSQMCSNFIIPDHQKQSPRYQDSLLQISRVITTQMLLRISLEIVMLVKSRQIVFDQMKHEERGWLSSQWLHHPVGRGIVVPAANAMLWDHTITIILQVI